MCLHRVATPAPIIKHTSSKVSGHLGQRLAPNDLGEVGETSPHVALYREGVNSTKPELNHVQSTTRGTQVDGNHVPVSSSTKSISSPGKDNEDAGSGSAAAVQIKSASKLRCTLFRGRRGETVKVPVRKTAIVLIGGVGRDAVAVAAPTDILIPIAPTTNPTTPCWP